MVNGDLEKLKALPTIDLLNIVRSQNYLSSTGDSWIIMELCRRLERLENETWLSPVEAEREDQENRLRKIWPGYPDVQFQHQTLNGLLNIAEAYFDNA